MDEQKTTGTLYIVATPIGNSRDMSERGREILSTADIIAAEDTRRSVVLLNKLGIRGNSLSANHKFNEYGKAKWFIEQLASGKDIAVITDAGTPCISDPGNELIRAAVENGIRVVGVPGCCAAVNALSISGFDLSSFLFYGFFPRETADRRRVLMMMRKGDTATYAFYESPKRIMSVIDFFIEENAQLCCSTVDGEVVIVNYKDEDVIHVGNRFMIYTLFPQCNISIHKIMSNDGKKTVFAVGKSVINRTSQLNVAELMAEHGGGGHRNAGTCQVYHDKANAVLKDIIEKINTYVH